MTGNAGRRDAESFGMQMRLASILWTSITLGALVIVMGTIVASLLAVSGEIFFIPLVLGLSLIDNALGYMAWLTAKALTSRIRILTMSGLVALDACACLFVISLAFNNQSLTFGALASFFLIGVLLCIFFTTAFRGSSQS